MASWMQVCKRLFSSWKHILGWQACAMAGNIHFSTERPLCMQRSKVLGNKFCRPYVLLVSPAQRSQTITAFTIRITMKLINQKFCNRVMTFSVNIIASYMCTWSNTQHLPNSHEKWCLTFLIKITWIICWPLSQVLDHPKMTFPVKTFTINLYLVTGTRRRLTWQLHGKGFHHHRFLHTHPYVVLLLKTWLCPYCPTYNNATL